jgi:hypothetical protein
MILYLFLIILNVAQADPTWKWSNALKIVEKHEFYENNEVLIKPKNSWQTLFAVLYNDSNLKTLKDCIFYKVPGEEKGILKIKTMAADKNCGDQLFLPGDQEWKNLKAVQFSVQDNFLSISMTNEQFQIEKWDVPLFNVFEHPQAKGLMSSAEYRSAKVIYLTPHKNDLKVKPQIAVSLTDKKICHDINEDCEEKSPSVCSQCSGGWYEIPNGCMQGPKYCGSIECGLKNQPACRRGMKYQKTDTKYGCREDNSFAYCAKGLIIQCQANLPYCM